MKEFNVSQAPPHPALETLQDALRHEHAGIVQMMVHAHRIGDLASMHTLEGIARQDMRHFKWLAEMVVRLGGNPTVERGPVYTETASPLIWLGRDVAHAEDALARYKLAAEIYADEEVRRLFTRLVADEEDHRTRLLDLVDHWRTQPEPVAPPELGHLEPHGETAQIHGFLDFAIKHEYAVILQYLQHSFLIEDQRVSRDMEEIAIEEMRHLGWLSEKLVERGGIPAWEVDRVELTEDPIRMLELDLAREIEVEADYKQVVAAMADPEIRRLFDRIGDHETYHAGVIGEMIARLKAAEVPAAPAPEPLSAARCPHLARQKTVGSLLGQAQP
jgi:bacterioferritin